MIKKISIILLIMIVLIGITSVGVQASSKADINSIIRGADEFIAAEQPVKTQVNQGMGIIVNLMIIASVFGAYFIPTVIACAKNHSYKVPIILINILLGWTFIGWVGSLIWSCIIPRDYSNNTQDNKKANKIIGITIGIIIGLFVLATIIKTMTAMSL